MTEIQQWNEFISINGWEDRMFKCQEWFDIYQKFKDWLKSSNSSTPSSTRGTE